MEDYNEGRCKKFSDELNKFTIQYLRDNCKDNKMMPCYITDILYGMSEAIANHLITILDVGQVENKTERFLHGLSLTAQSIRKIGMLHLGENKDGYLLKTVVLEKGDEVFTVEGWRLNKRFVVNTKSKTLLKSEESVAYCGSDSLEFVQAMETEVNEKVDKGFKITKDESDEDKLEKAGIVPYSKVESDGPPKPIRDMSLFLASELQKSLAKEGFDVGDYSTCMINFSRGKDEKELKEAIMIVKFMRGERPKNMEEVMEKWKKS